MWNKVFVSIQILLCCSVIHGERIHRKGISNFQPSDKTRGFSGGVSLLRHHNRLLRGGRYPTPNTGKTYGGRHLETFNRPVGTEALVVDVSGRENLSKAGAMLDSAYGRTFGQYGSYRNHTSWQNAVANDIQNNLFGTKNADSRKRWMLKGAISPTVEGFGVKGFWNSYATIPEGIQAGQASNAQKTFNDV
ncbi:hypothetical protein MAR_015663 [Mya arenaria]|uniref:Gloverin n=1 Tax=Mya arenaria TaxID=6604 RepID=A0ABY7FK22_MYAAR|nr:hypothetical protein MAR_015663 [Mya arenaria]